MIKDFMQNDLTKHWDKNAISQLMLEAGNIALSYYDKPGVSVKEDHSLVTLADVAIEQFFQKQFDHPHQNSFLIGEESVDSKGEDYLENALAHTAFVVDPIDGTAPYAHHIPLWGVSLGKMEKGQLVEGAIYLPVLKELFISEGADAYYCSNAVLGEPLTFSKIDTPLKSWSPTGIVAITQSLAKGDRLSLDNPVHCLACAVFPLAYLLLGRYEAYLGKLKLWDLAGGLPLLLKMGFEVQNLEGHSFSNDVDENSYHLEASDPKRWKTRGALVFAPKKEACERILTAVHGKL
jgi:myo-inositol-1(or 4)-monophosphatase